MALARTVLMAAFFAAWWAAPPPATAQLGWTKKVGKLKDVRVGVKGDRTTPASDDGENSSAASKTSTEAAQKAEPAQAQEEQSGVKKQEDAETETAGWKQKIKTEIQSTWTVTHLATDRLRVTDPGTVFVIKSDGITGDLAKDSTFSKTTVEQGHVLAPKGAVAFLQNKKTSRPFKEGEKVYLWKTAVGDDYVGLFLVSYDTFPVNERGGRTAQTRYKAYVAFKFDKDHLPTAKLPDLKQAISQVIVPEAEAQATATKTISLGQSTKEVEDILGKPERVINLGPKVTYMYKDLKVIFQDGKVSDVQ